MKVYYNSSLWDKSKGIYGRPQKINWEFEDGGLRRIIPNIYHFSKGIVFDLITIIDEKEFSKFYNKYIDIEEELSPLEQRLVEQEHPYDELSLKDIWINGEKVKEGYSGSGAFYSELNGEQNELSKIKKAYSSILEDVNCFNCYRYMIPYPEADSKIDKLLRFFHLYKIKEIKFDTYPKTKFYPLEGEFEMSLEENLKEIIFTHPTTGIEHRLYFQNPELLQIEDLYLIQAKYEIEPELLKWNNLQFDSSIHYGGMSTVDMDSNSAASIGIIGGADGPTSIIIAGREDKEINYGQKGLPLHNALSIPSLKNQDIYKFILEGINIRIGESEEYRWKL
jgi:hypothetical protein